MRSSTDWQVFHALLEAALAASRAVYGRGDIGFFWQWDMLLGQLLRIGATKPLYKLYAELVAATRDDPIDPGWHGITNFETK